MNTKSPTSSEKPCADCNVDDIDALTCTARKIQKEAEVTKESLDILNTRRDEFKAARTAYTEARTMAKVDVDDAKSMLAPLLKELSCLLEECKKQCLTEVWGQVWQDIDDCLGKGGCRIGDCTFDSSVSPSDTQATLTGRIYELRECADDLDAYFQTLVDEQGDLRQRASDAKQAVEQLKTDVASDTEATKTLELYARALVAKWHIEGVWRGFSSVDAYLDCLCRTLTCLLHCWQEIVVLEGAKEERKCGDEAKQERCDVLVANPVDELLSRYQKECSHRSSWGGNTSQST